MDRVPQRAPIVPWVLLAASAAVLALAPFAGLVAAPFPLWRDLFPAAASYPTLLTGLGLCGLFAATFRRGTRWLRTGLASAAITVAGLSIAYDLMGLLVDAPPSRFSLGMLPGLSALLLALLALVLRRNVEAVDQHVLALSATIYCLSVSEVLVAVSMHSGVIRASVGGSLPAATAFAMLGAAGLIWRRRCFPGGVFSGDVPAWRAVRVGIPLAVLVPVDRFVLAANRDSIEATLYAQLDLLATILNVLATGLLFTWTTWKLAREYQRIRDKEIRLSLAIEAPGAGMFDWNVLTGDLTWTPEAERRVGFAPGTITTVQGWAERIIPDDLLRVRAAMAAVTTRRGEHCAYRFRLRTAGGALRTFEGSARCFYDDEGSFIRAIGMNLDVTERDEREAALEEREAQLRSIVENVPDAMVVFDESGCIQRWSNAAERMFGYAADLIVGANVRLLLPPQLLDLPERYDALRRETGERQLVGRTVTLSARRATGEVFPIELTAGEAQVRNGRLFIAFVRDIAERVESQRNLDALRDEFAHSARLTAMGEMAAGLAHELNQPLSAGANYLGAAEMIVEEDLQNEELAALLASARGQLLRAGQIIRRLRDFLAKGSADMRVVSVKDTITEAVALGLIGNQDHPLEVSYTLTSGAEHMLADRIQIQQVLVNLLRNAAEASRALPSERRKVTIAARPIDAERLRITVIDHGPGLPQHVLDQLYTPFMTTKGEHGLGIGLAICRRIVEAHGGEFAAVNRAEGGASIAFTLSRAAPADTDGRDA